MIEQAVVRTHSLLFAAALALAVGCFGCKDTGSPGSGAPGQVEGSAAGGEVRSEPGGGGGGQVGGEEVVAPVATATAAEEAAPAPNDSTVVFVECTTRTNICTREFMPVCGTLTSGERRTYPNKCVACSDQAVRGYVANACEDQPGGEPGEDPPT